MRVHPHVERSVRLKTESSAGIVKLHRTDAQIGQHAVRAAGAAWLATSANEARVAWRVIPTIAGWSASRSRRPSLLQASVPVLDYTPAWLAPLGRGFEACTLMVRGRKEQRLAEAHRRIAPTEDPRHTHKAVADFGTERRRRHAGEYRVDYGIVR